MEETAKSSRRRSVSGPSKGSTSGGKQKAPFGPVGVRSQRDPGKPIFLDPSGRRWRVAVSLACVVGFLLAGLGFATTREVFARHGSLLPQPLPAAAAPVPRPVDTPSSEDAECATPTKGQSGKGPRVLGFVVDWDPASETSLRENVAFLDDVIFDWLRLKGPDGSVSASDPARLSGMIEFARQNRPGIRLLVNVVNFSDGEWREDWIAAMLADPSARTRNIDALLAFVQRHHLDGISVDYEKFPKEGLPDLTRFMAELYGRFHSLGLLVTQNVPAVNLNLPFDYKAIEPYNDFLILMAFEAQQSTGGAITPQGWFDSVLKERFAEIPSSKYVIAIGNYGYDWNSTGKRRVALTFGRVMEIARNTAPEIRLDEASLNPFFDYRDDSGEMHHVWFLDAVTAFNEIRSSRTSGIQGFALWRLGSEDRGVWNALRANGLPERDSAALKNVPFGYQPNTTGDGLLLKIDRTTERGSREVDYDSARGLIVKEKFTAFPCRYIVHRWGSATGRKVALTFDGAPGAQTPEILATLRELNVPATFFVSGSAATRLPDLTRQILADGHELGNQTFSFPLVEALSATRLRAELNSTSLVLEHLTGRTPTLFRPPYGQERLLEQGYTAMEPLVLASENGYSIVQKDALFDASSQGTDAAIADILLRMTPGSNHVIALRADEDAQVAKALPRLVGILRDRGFELVTVSELAGLGRSALMPEVPETDASSRIVRSSAYLASKSVVQVGPWVLVVAMGLCVLRLLVITTLATVRKVRLRRASRSSSLPRVAVLVPAHNEAKVICKTLRSLLRSDYPRLDIVFVDDGSTDGTFELVTKEFAQEGRVRPFAIAHAGKNAALNHGFAQSDAEIVVTVDADSLLASDAISRLIERFSDERVAAVAGNVKVGNRRTVLTWCQSLEYVSSQSLDRSALEVLNCIAVVPGAIGAWRRSAVRAVGGFCDDTLAEDADLTVRLLRAGFRVVHAADSFGFTEAPECVKNFLKQRFRWCYGFFQVVCKHKDAFLNPRTGTVGLVLLPYILVFQLILSFVALMGDIFCLGVLGWWWSQSAHVPAATSQGALWATVGYLSFSMGIECLAGLLALALEPRENWRLLLWVPVQRLVYRPLLYCTFIRVLVMAVKGRAVGWNSCERKATVSEHKVLGGGLQQYRHSSGSNGQRNGDRAAA